MEIQQNIALCQHCGSLSPQHLVFRHETRKKGRERNGNVEEASAIKFRLVLCEACDQPSLYSEGREHHSARGFESHKDSVLLWPTKKAIREYAVVWEKRLTRSGMPKKRSGWEWLRSQGVKSIVTFRNQNDVDYAEFGFEHVVRIPISCDPPDPPSDQQAEEFLRIIQDPNNTPVHMHCTAGKNRTGMMAALARYSIDGWPMEEALEEARSYRLGKDLPPKRMAWLFNWASKHEPGSYRLSD